MTRVETYDQAVDLVNRNPYGNGVALFTRDGGAARQFTFEVEAGMVGINVPIRCRSPTTRSAGGRARCSATPTCTGRRASVSTRAARWSRSGGRTGEELGRPRLPRAVNERWDGDRTGAGVSDGEAFARPIRGLLDEMARPDWNTEQPEAHLLPHLERWCGREDSPFALRSAALHGTVFVVDLESGRRRQSLALARTSMRSSRRSPSRRPSSSRASWTTSIPSTWHSRSCPASRRFRRAMVTSFGCVSTA